MLKGSIVKGVKQVCTFHEQTNYFFLPGKDNYILNTCSYTKYNTCSLGYVRQDAKVTHLMFDLSNVF